MISFRCPLPNAKVVVFILDFEIVRDDLSFVCSLEDKELIGPPFCQLFLNSLQTGSPFPLALIFRLISLPLIRSISQLID
jgi:hypothetical protein